MNPWKPIETAPKDGTPILVGCWQPNHHWNQTTKTYDDPYTVWHATVASWDTDYQWQLIECGSYADDGDISFTPTHWTEIPTPPQQPQ